MTAISYQEIYAVVSCIPAGFVATYGQIACLAGIPGHARQVGYALSALNDHSPIPWHRVVNAKGMISPRSGSSPMEQVQHLLLEGEGVSFDEHGRIPLSRFQWRHQQCICGRDGRDKGCPLCGKGEELGYWCANCEQAVAEKRCPLCGLKARKIREKKERA